MPEIKKVTELTFNGAESEILYLEGRVLAGLEIPVNSAFDSKTLTPYVSNDRKTFLPIYGTEGSAYTITIGSGRYIFMDPGEWAGVAYVKFVAGVSLDGLKIKAVAYRD